MTLLLEGEARRKFNSLDEEFSLLCFLQWYFARNKLAAFVGYEKLTRNPNCPCPDFVVKINNRRVGIEVTQIPEMINAQQARYMLIQKFERNVEKCLGEAHLSGTIHFNIHYQSDAPFAKLRSEIFANEISDFLLKNIKEGIFFGNFYNDEKYQLINEQSASGKIYRLPTNFQDTIWYAFLQYHIEKYKGADTIYFPRPMPYELADLTQKKELIIDRIAKKDKIPYLNCRHIDEMWLVMRNREEWSFDDAIIPKDLKLNNVITGYEGIYLRNGRQNPKPKINRLK